MLIEHNERKTMKYRLLFCLAATIGLILSFQSTASAHKVYIYAWFEGDVVYTESYFGAKKKVKDGLVQVYDLSGRKLLEGRTNERGEYSFRFPQKTGLRIVVDAGMGHRNECVLKAKNNNDIPGVESESANNDRLKEDSFEMVSKNEEAIKSILEQVLDSRLKPIKQELARIRKEESPGFTEIMGGIGYIFGLMGLLMYFKSRKK